MAKMMYDAGNGQLQQQFASSVPSMLNSSLTLPKLLRIQRLQHQAHIYLNEGPVQRSD